MNRSYKIYGIIVIIGVCLATWTALRWQKTVDQRFDSLKRQPKKVIAPPPTRFDAEYDRRGRVAAIRVFHHGLGVAKNSAPLFWAKGNLIVVSKKDWESTDLDYQRADISRDLLHQMISDVSQLKTAARPESDLTVISTQADGTRIVRYANSSAFHKQVSSWLGSRELRSYTLQAVELLAEKPATDVKALQWPVGGVSMRKLLASGSIVVRKHDHVRRIQKVLRMPAVYKQGKHIARITAVAHVDR